MAQVDAPDPADYFPGQPTALEIGGFTLPTEQDLPSPQDLNDAKEAEYDILLEDNKDDDIKLVKTRYSHVRHPVLDNPVAGRDPGEEENRIAACLLSCHNGLYDARNQNLLLDENVYELMVRLLTWVQTNVDGFKGLGALEDRKWWVAPKRYRLGYVPGSSVDPIEAKLGDGIPGVDHPENDVKDFQDATFSLHLSHNDDHFGLIIYHAGSGSAWYLDSLKYQAEKRRDNSEKKFEKWLQVSNQTVPPNFTLHLMPVPYQKDGWSCGLHCIANAVAFVRFGVLGWNNVPALGAGRAADMVKAISKSLHNIMGLADPSLAFQDAKKQAAAEAESKKTASDSAAKPAPKKLRTLPPMLVLDLNSPVLVGGGRGPPPDHYERPPKNRKRRPSRYDAAVAAAALAKDGKAAGAAPGSPNSAVSEDAGSEAGLDDNAKKAKKEAKKLEKKLNPRRKRRLRVRSPNTRPPVSGEDSDGGDSDGDGSDGDGNNGQPDDGAAPAGQSDGAAPAGQPDDGQPNVGNQDDGGSRSESPVDISSVEGSQASPKIAAAMRAASLGKRRRSRAGDDVRREGQQSAKRPRYRGRSK
ncbi:hypothetical protein QBC47DRAFT_431694 [Echria macrotheca]|uniref:Ubiquitin-like protease family profile domain-containing protein n=1 Tax=Echria macrotheca TaxID=438768 RepID=A0AAJ0B8N7_9PEZI|nr:hypothetical protein QBC47DRAFT_431694 [Echria macrotheca]